MYCSEFITAVYAKTLFVPDDNLTDSF